MAYSYTKTSWVNDTGPAIDADNLNNIEDGIEGALGDSVTNASAITTINTTLADTSAPYPYAPSGTGAEQTTVGAKLGEFVSVLDFGADNTGTDDAAADIQAALDAHSNVYIPPGTYILDVPIEIPANRHVRGGGMNNTILKRKTGVSDQLNTVEIHSVDHVTLVDIQIDGNKAGTTVGGSGPRGTCVSIISADYITCERVFAKNGSLHCFDITTPAWNTTQYDYTYQANPCNYVTLRGCVATGGGDDNITTHYSNYILIDGCYSYSPAGTHVSTNHNCFEVDDGSRFVTITNCVAKDGIRGIEVKGHDYAPAAQDVNISNMIIEDCVVGIGLRHIGHYDDTDPESTTAFRVNIDNVLIKNLADSSGFQGSPSVESKGLQLWVYGNVNVTNVNIVDTNGSGGEVSSDQGVVHVTHRAHGMNLNNINVKGYTGAESGIHIENQAGTINTRNISLTNCYVDGAGSYLYHVEFDLDDISFTNVQGDNATVGVKLSKATPNDYPFIMTGSQFGGSVTYAVEVGTTTPDQYANPYDWMDRININRPALGETTAVELDSDGGFDATASFHRVDSNGASGSDVLEYIGNGFPGQIMILRAEDTGRTITVRDATNGSVAHPTPNLTLAGQADFALDTLNDTITLVYDDGQDEWLELSRSNN